MRLDAEERPFVGSGVDGHLSLGAHGREPAGRDDRTDERERSEQENEVPCVDHRRQPSSISGGFSAVDSRFCRLTT